jgi:capsular exopolysaccharide synthesis family protein
MSRIHEALKRAEQERAASQGAHASPAQEAAATVTEISGSGLPAIPSFATPFNWDAVLARCPQREWSPDKTMLFFHDEQARGTEQFRTLRSRFYQAREKAPLKKVLVTSALPREGKSFVAANLAQVLVRQPGRRALLMDCDLRAARLHKTLGTQSAPGLADYLSGDADEFSILQRGPMENLFLIPCGREASSPAELLANGRLAELLARVESLFDWIILDSPPLAPVSDAALLSRFCDGVLMVVRSNVTPFDVAQKARQEFSDKLLIGVVLNGIDAGSAAYPDYYYKIYKEADAKEKKG